ncbi:hypothetical protein D9756_006371 [Leucocoprinus leucothites]|uniref:Cystathionine gamma-synthase n=1 Tax=Leucocoprinus leucothites TaxID=201217 RepID=A0A8H5LH52_9AGAR|nr:hypothetical protein D9756_006371 [Leucoagaricus leucothites]
MSVALGLSVPAHTAHAVSVSLPKWQDNVGYEEGEQRVVNAMISGYPRFFIHLSIRRLATVCEQKYAVGNEQCMLFPARHIAEECRDFIRRRSQSDDIQPRLVHLFICPEDVQPTPANTADLHIVLIPAEAFGLAREFWQHTGLGISSRLADKCLSLLPDESKPSPPARPPARTHNRHYSVKGAAAALRPSTSPTISYDIPKGVPTTTPPTTDLLSSDHTTYLEERYGRNLPLSAAESAKRALRRRIAGTLIRDNYGDGDCGDEPCAGLETVKTGPSSRGVKSVTEDDVYLYPGGMAAIWSAHKLLRETRPEGKSVCFGFPYTDTLKILQKWGPGAHFFGSGLDSDIDSLEDLLSSSSNNNNDNNTSATPPILALFTEFPSNPLLRSANLPRLRQLADKYNFILVVDETIGNFVNVDVLPYADIVASSLTKVFSGASNVMGGSLVLNPNSKHYPLLKSHLSKTYIDTYFYEDAIYLERNSRDFQHRISLIDKNTESICDYLRSRSVVGGCTDPDAAIKEVFYPKYVTTENYNLCRTSNNTGGSRGGYGGLFSLTFTSPLASSTFFDNLPCQKGPSLGTNFTLACPYTVLAHYGEMEWAEGWGVERGLVRVSVGLDLVCPGSGGEEGKEGLWEGFVDAVRKAEEVVRGERGRSEGRIF